jgi:hypothetical protein
MCGLPLAGIPPLDNSLEETELMSDVASSFFGIPGWWSEYPFVSGPLAKASISEPDRQG